MPPSDEVARVERAYARRAERIAPGFYSLLQTGNLYRTQRRERTLVEILATELAVPLEEAVVLDVGCGHGETLRQMVRYGADLHRLVGVDVLSERLDKARDLAPHLRFELIDGQTLPYADETFDVVMQFTVFSSILDLGVQRSLAAEMMRVLKPGGIVVWYDMRVTDPRNQDLTPMTRERIRELFPRAELVLAPHTLIPALSRRIAPVSWALCSLLELVPALKGHLMGVIRPHAAAQR